MGRDTRTEKMATLRDMPPAELEERISEMRGEAMRIKFRASVAGIAKDESTPIRELQRDIARALTIQNERRDPAAVGG